MRYIATIYTDTGHDYSGPDEDLKAIIADAKSVAANWEHEYPSPVLNIYVNPFDEDTSMPDSDADPLWMWDRTVALEQKSRSKSSGSSKPARKNQTRKSKRAGKIQTQVRGLR